MTTHLDSQDQGDLFEWFGEKPVEHAVKQFACDTIAGIVGTFSTLPDFCDNLTMADYWYTTPGGIRVRAGWKLRHLRRSAHGGKSPRIIEANFEPEGREFSLFAKMEFSPYFELDWDSLRSRYACSPTKVSLQGGSGDMEACHRWLMLWKLYR